MNMLQGKKPLSSFDITRVPDMGMINGLNIPLAENHSQVFVMLVKKEVLLDPDFADEFMGIFRNEVNTILKLKSKDKFLLFFSAHNKVLNEKWFIEAIIKCGIALSQHIVPTLIATQSFYGNKNYEYLAYFNNWELSADGSFPSYINRELFWASELIWTDLLEEYFGVKIING